ncbi:unnamed protein product [Miscanthus lutarioriparius]|uniref:Uncharacterized protein n=1 Tax=Miscanthus lutarioriparius TaxID=422564 RepID=A0A811NDD8_9POAL|nr:unnamed protein product [Miscanthus lutarioriparius]
MASREGGAGAAAGQPALRVGRTREYRTGMETELLSIGAGASGGPAVSLFVLASGVHGHLHRRRPPVDAGARRLVARIDSRAFVFELPGFFYAVVVPPDAAGGAAERKCATMAEIFSRFCAYHDLAAADGGDEPAGELNTNPWVRAHARIQRLKRHTSPTGQAAADAPSDRARQMERAVRTSAVVKLLTRSLLAGVLQPGRHLTITTGGGAANAGTSSRPSTAALPSKSVVSDLLDAIETNRAAPRRDARRGSGGSGGLGWWNLNVEGIMLLLRVVQAVRGRKHLAAPAAGEKRPRDEGPGRDTMRGGGAARRWCGGRPRKIGNTVGACGSS